jgi:DnaD/phage-associated family protein
MAIYRVHKNKNYTTINNYLIRDKNLNLKDKGMMVVLLSLPDGWDFSVMGLEVICKEARNTINSILNNLQEHGYLERTKVYEKGKIKDWKYDIYEIPKNLYRKNEDIENEDIKNDTQLNTNKLNTKELNNTTTNTIFDLLEENGFQLAPLQYEIIKTWEDTELTRYAIKKAVLNNKFNINYIQKILNSYEKENIKTVQQAVESDEAFERRRNNYYKNKYSIRESQRDRERRLMEEYLNEEE